jgi:hypothetical protein
MKQEIDKVVTSAGGLAAVATGLASLCGEGIALRLPRGNRRHRARRRTHRPSFERAVPEGPQPRLLLFPDPLDQPRPAAQLAVRGRRLHDGADIDAVEIRKLRRSLRLHARDRERELLVGILGIGIVVGRRRATRRFQYVGEVATRGSDPPVRPLERVGVGGGENAPVLRVAALEDDSAGVRRDADQRQFKELTLVLNCGFFPSSTKNSARNKVAGWGGRAFSIVKPPSQQVLCCSRLA